jgi:CRISPR-associated endonuclease/helicase Cas3
MYGEVQGSRGATTRAMGEVAEATGVPRGKGNELFFAHTRAGQPVETWQPLRDHLEGVAELAEQRASSFDAGAWGRLAGLWHDLGKYSAAFQTYLRSAGDPHEGEESGRVDHATAGAQHAARSQGVLGHLLAFPVAGHHSGLLDAIGPGACMQARLLKSVEPYESAPYDLLQQQAPEIPAYLRKALGRRDPFSVSFFVRMLFSSLVDADFVDTEQFMDPARAEVRPRWPADILARMSEALDGFLDAMDPPDTDVNRHRASVLEACLRAAHREPGIFSLTVPTGGGKTLSSLAFALTHAVRHDLRRVIYVAPFTSIIEQNAGVFRSVMAPLTEEGVPDPVLEHHSNLDPERESVRSRLAAENWDAPLVVTTSVQFYESLFASRSSRCRKLHNLARGVVILDEAQALPVDYLSPCLRALRELTESYGASLVLCTATQPAIERRSGFNIGMEVDESSEIVPDPAGLFEALRRVEVSVEPEPVADEELAQRLLDEKQVLCIVNTRGHAVGLSELLGDGEESCHLSALMCAEHRAAELSRVTSRLEQGLECRVVSTRLIEAGVDIDFPTVYRAVAGIDSVAQAAGRCNRNGLRPAGRVIVFQSEHSDSERFLADTAAAARQVFDLHSDVLSLAAVEGYFRLYYWDQAHRWDRKGILDEFQLAQDRSLPFLFGFARAARDFRLIEDTGRAVFIPWGPRGARLCDELRNSWGGPSFQLLRSLQRYVVQVPESVWRRNLDTAFELVHGQYAVLAFPERHYSARTGLRLPDTATDALIA